ncbi:MAG: glycosyltransferase [bacterium]
MKPSPRPSLSYVVNSLNPGGTERLVVEMSCAFSTDYNVEVVCLDEPGSWANDLRTRGIPVHVLWRQAGLDLTMAAKLAERFRRHKTRIVHAHQCTPWFYSALSRLVYREPRLLFEEHGRFYPEVRKSPRVLVNRALVRRLTHRIVAVSADIRQRLVRYEGLDAGEIEVVYNGVAAPPLLEPDKRNALRRELGFGPLDFIVGTVGRFDSIKNLPMLIASLEASGRQIPSLRGLLVGHGPGLLDIHALAQRGAMADRIVFTGYRDDARTLVQCLDLFVLSSFSEGTSMALLEAMAVGLPVAVTSVGGNPEVVVANQTGWTVPSGSTDELTQVFLKAVNDPHKRRQFAEAGRRRFQEHFAIDRMLEAYAQRYHELLARAL